MKLILCALFSLSLAELGIDLIDSVSDFSCLRNQGYNFVITRGYRESGAVDPVAKGNLAAAKAAGMETDVYFFPCFPCGNPASQASEFWSQLGGDFGTVWLDIETSDWSSSQADNQSFIITLAHTLSGYGASVGVYTNYYNWESIVGLGWTGLSNYPLGYAAWDNTPSFSGFQPFGGWSSPSMKQFTGTTTVCGVGVDQDFR